MDHIDTQKVVVLDKCSDGNLGGMYSGLDLMSSNNNNNNNNNEYDDKIIITIMIIIIIILS